MSADEKKTLRLGLPKGSLQDATVDLFKKAGYNIRISGRSYYPSIDDPDIECTLLRAQEMSRYVGAGLLDCGLTGRDWVIENTESLLEVKELEYAKATLTRPRWVVAVHNDSPYKSVKDLEGKRIATEAVQLAERYLAEQGVKAHVEFSWGATEVKIPKLADAILEITETGSSLKANNLRIIDQVMETVTVFIAHRDAWEDDAKRDKMTQMLTLLSGSLNAQQMVGLMLNVHKNDLSAVQEKLPAMKNPTINELTDKDWFELMTIVSKHEVRDLIPELKAAGAVGIVEFPLNKVID